MSSQASAEADQTIGVIPNAPWRIKALSVLPGHRLAVTFQDYTSGVVDFSAVLTARDCGMYHALKDKACFEAARIELGVVTWPGEVDIDPAWMYEEVRQNKTWSVPF